jgi:hypothetical protein
MRAGHVFAQAADLVQALRLSHFELELQAEKLIIELLLLVQQFSSGQTSKFFDIHVFLSSSLLGLNNAFGCCALMLRSRGPALTPHFTRSSDISLR